MKNYRNVSGNVQLSSADVGAFPEEGRTVGNKKIDTQASSEK